MLRLLTLIGLVVSSFGAVNAPPWFGAKGNTFGWVGGTTTAGGASTLLTGLSLYAKFNESSGNAADSSGNGFTLANHASATFTAGKINNAATFDSSSSQYFDLADNNTISTGDQDFEIAAWVKLTDKAASRVIVQKGWDDAYGEFLLYYNGGADRFQFWIANGNGSSFVVDSHLGAPATGTWYYVSASYTASTDSVRIAINNGTADTVTYAGGNTTTTGTLKVGTAFGSYMNGQIDDLMFWSARNLTSAERAEYYKLGNGTEP